MARILCIDRGNSRIKMALFQEHRIVTQQEGNEDAALILTQTFITDHKPDGVIVCSVAGQNKELDQLLIHTVPNVLTLTPSTPLPIMNAYTSSDTVGVDRLAIAVAAQHQFPGVNVLAVSLGTCITYNFIQKNKAFRGGAIAPGLHMRLRAMHEFTHQLPAVAVDGEMLLLGYDTETCMRSGAFFGMLAEIEGMVAAYENQFPGFNAVLTGGYLPRFAGKFKREIFADPDLLLKGLNLILQHNVPQLR